ncbi:ThuA domain-containing protein [Thalassotalea litorea]|uniref:ThuA domain-containing protein n=1 Tax=Thalassotalea litorea TaxID=2020715 RepID=A0A5R9IJM9_9GAMM|nr:ThuA domain-containing protein [Thalassotalea litorea]TLU65754.1 ThuA domain-containing protein [Thalassotalea litorea]
MKIRALLNIVGLSALVYSLTGLSPSTALEAEANKLNVLIVDGQNNHKVWPVSTAMMRQYLLQTGLFSVDVYRTEPVWRFDFELSDNAFRQHAHKSHFKVDEPISDPSFRPDFDRYDVVVSNFGYKAAPWPEATQQAFTAFVGNGGGFVSVHAANNAFPDWPEYNLLTGLGGWGDRDEHAGPYVYFDEQGQKVIDHSKGPAGAHGNKHEFQIRQRNVHPITADLPQVWMHSKDECYGKLRGPAVNMNIIATAYCPAEEQGTGRHEPALMTITYKQGRIFHTTLGHQQESFESVGFIVTFTRGVQWAATGEVTLAKPQDFPSENASSRRPFIIDTSTHNN